MRPGTSLNHSPFPAQLPPGPLLSPKDAPASLTRNLATTIVSAQGRTKVQGRTRALQLGRGSMQAQGSMLELELGQGNTAALGNSMPSASPTTAAHLASAAPQWTGTPQPPPPDLLQARHTHPQTLSHLSKQVRVAHTIICTACCLMVKAWTQARARHWCCLVNVCLVCLSSPTFQSYLQRPS